MSLSLPRTIKFIFFTLFANLLIFTAIRVVFYTTFYEPDDPISREILFKSLYIGFKFDLKLALLINLPILCFSWINPIGIFRSNFGRRLWIIYLCITTTMVLLIYFIDFGHYAYLKSRLNAETLRLLYNPITSLRMIWETYPVIWGSMGLLVFTSFYGYIIKKLSLRFTNNDVTPTKQKVLSIVFTILFFVAGIYGKFSYYPLRWSDAFFSIHPFASSLALNPVLYLFDTLRIRSDGYDVEEVKKHYSLMVDYLGISEFDKDKLNFLRKVDKGDRASTKPNIIIVLLESLASHKTGMFGNPLNPTPNLDAIAKDSLFFKRFYVQSAGTARSVFTLITGIPDVEINSTSSRNPMIVKQHTIINAFRDYEKFYFIGGSANWANIRGLLSHNIPGLHLYEEINYNSPRIDVWGISDLHLFEETNRILKEAKSPFFAIIHTSGSHRPYSIPEDNRGFRTVSIKNADAERYGFVSEAEFNSFRFLDHSVGLFIETAKKAPYFKDTFFIFFGDHGLPGNAPHMPKSEELLELTRFHVPFLIYAPEKIKKGIANDKIANELDVLPTIASLVSIPYWNTTIGRDLFDSSFDNKRYAFTILDQGTNPLLGLLSDKFYFVMNANGTNKRLHLYYSETPRENVLKSYTGTATEMELILRAIYETAKYIRYHNILDRTIWN